MRSSALLALAVSVVLSGCVIHDHTTPPPPAQPGNVDFVWSFNDGQTCATLAGAVDHVRINVNGEVLANSGVFPCQTAGTQGVQLQNFAAGSYSFSILAESAGGAPVYQATGQFVVNGNVVVAVGFTRVSTAQPGNVNFVWAFADGQSCASLGAFVDHMRISIPGEQLANNGIFPCQAAGTQGVQLQNFLPGNYSYTVTAENSNNVPLYEAQGPFLVNGNIVVNVTLTAVNAAARGNVRIYWALPGGLTCQSAGIDHMVLNIPNEQLSNGGVFPCQSGPQNVNGIQLNDFAPASYTVSIDAVDASGTPRFHGSGSFTINGDTAVTVPLTQSTGSMATLQLRWSFGEGGGSTISCAQAGVDQVSVVIGNSTPQTVPCTGASSPPIDGADFRNLSAGQYRVQLQGLHGGQVTYTYDQNIVVGAPVTQVPVVMAPLYGSWDLAYNFSNAASCAVAGVSSVTLSVKDASGAEISGTNGQHYTCGEAASGTNVFHYAQIPGGYVTVQLYGYSSSGAVIRGASRATTLVAGGANQNLFTLDTCGTSGSGC